jgi:hypothetical protein
LYIKPFSDRNVGSANKDEEVNLNSTVTSIPEVISVSKYGMVRI